MNSEYSELIASNRVSPQTRAVLQVRGKEDEIRYRPEFLSVEQLVTLRSLADRIVPQDSDYGSTPIDLGARLDQQLAMGEGDGWRYASLPSDAAAYSIGLHVIDELAIQLEDTPFHALASAAQNSLLEDIAAGSLSSTRIDLKRWFEDVRADLTKLYVAHPDTLARMNYSGIADDPNGFVQIGIGRLEDWEPRGQ